MSELPVQHNTRSDLELPAMIITSIPACVYHFMGDFWEPGYGWDCIANDRQCLTDNSLECRSREITPLFWPSHLVWLLYATSKMVAEEYCIVKVDIQET